MRAIQIILISIFLVCVVAVIFGRHIQVDRPIDWLYRPMAAEPETLNPITTSDASAGSILHLVMEQLCKRDLFTFEWHPWLAERWEISDDKLDFTFYLRKGVRWHDGTELTADDVLYSYNRITKDKIGRRAHIAAGWVDNESCEVIDKYTVKFRWKKVYFLAFNYIAGMPIVSRKAFNNVTERAFDEHPQGRVPTGTGPYKVASWDTGKRIILERNEDYWGEKPFFKRINYLIISEHKAELGLFKKEVVDTTGPTPIQWLKQTNSPRFKHKFIKVSYPSFAYRFIVWNNDRVWFRDKRVRRAMTHLVDRQKIIDKILFGFGEVISGPAYPASPAYNHDIKPLPYDPEKAKQLLDEAGWIDHDGDGIRDKDGVPFDFEFIVVSTSSFSPKLAVILQDELRKVGVRMRMRNLEWSIFLKYFHERNFDATSLGWIMGIEIDHYDLWHSSQADLDQSSNCANFRNKEADKLIEAIRVEFDEEKRNEMNRRFHEIIHEEQPYTFMFVDKSRIIYNRRLQNVRFSPLFPGSDIAQWYAVQEEKIDRNLPSEREEK